jgi:hypothetical protein
MDNLDGTWIYQSFRPERGGGEAPSRICVPWAPPATLNVSTDPKTGKVVGSLDFGHGIELSISGSVTPAGQYWPQGIELTGEGHSSLNQIRGYFIEGNAGPLIVGTVVAIRNDLTKQPDGTCGPFVLFQTIG